MPPHTKNHFNHLHGIDKDISDQTFFTAQKEILSTNKYEWKTLQINYSYKCSTYFFNGVANCTELGE